MCVPDIAMKGKGKAAYVWQGFGGVLRADVHMFTWARDVRQRALILKPLGHADRQALACSVCQVTT
jgi:hypothetical protein